MPQVPVYGGPQVKSEPLQPNYQNNVDVSSGTRAVAQGLMQVGEVVDRVVVRDAQDEAFKIEQQVRSEWQQQRAALRSQYRGDQADQYKEKAAEWWAKARDTYGANASPMARAAAGKSIGQYMVQAEADTLGYVEGEKTKTREINFRTLQDTIITEAGQTVTPQNAGALAATTAAQIEKNAIAYAAGEGLNSDVGKRMAREQLNKFHAEVAVSLASKPGGAEAAKKYLSEFGAEIPLGVRTRVDEIVNAEVDNQFATTFAAQQAGKPLSEQIKAAGEIQEPARKEKAMVAIKNNYAMVEQAKREQWSAAAQQAFGLANTGKPVPAALRATMDQENDVPKLDALIKARADRLAVGAGTGGPKPVKTDWPTYINLRERMAAGEKINLTAYTEKLAPGQLEQLLDIQTAAAKPGSAKQESMLSDEQRMLLAKPATLDPKKDPEAYGKYVSEIDRRVRAASAAKGDKPLSPDEKQKIVDSVAKDTVFVEEFGSDPQKPTSLLTPAEMGKAYVKVGKDGTPVKLSTVPMDDRRRLIGILQRRNEPVTEQAIIELFLRSKQPQGSW